jgi:hypothetical protein
MQHSDHLHPEFGLFSPTPRLRREMRIVATSLLFGGIAGALCVSGVIALRPSDRAAMEFAERSGAPASKDSELGAGPSVDTRGAKPEVHANTAAPHASAEESPKQGSGDETSAPAVAPASDVAPKARMVRVRKTVESPAIARVPLGRSEVPAAASPGDAPESTQASNAAPAVPPAAPEKAGVHPGVREAVANSSPPKKKVQKTVRTASSRRDDIESDSFWRDGRTDDWSARPAAPASADVRGATPEKDVTRTGASEALVDSSPPKTVRNASSRRNDTRDDSFWRDERTDDWSTRAAVPASADVWGAMPEKADTRMGAGEGPANSSPPKKALKTVRDASSRRNDTGNDSFWRDERQDDWRARPAAVNDGRSAAGRAYAREATSSFRGFWDWSR